MNMLDMMNKLSALSQSLNEGYSFNEKTGRWSQDDGTSFDEEDLDDEQKARVEKWKKDNPGKRRGRSAQSSERGGNGSVSTGLTREGIMDEPSTKETPTGRVHTAKPGGYGRKDDQDDEGKKVKSSAAPRGRGRPKKGADSDTGEVMKPDWSAFGGPKADAKSKDAKLPKWDKSKTTKHSLKEYFDLLDKAINEGGLAVQPIPAPKQTGQNFMIKDPSNPQAAAITTTDPAVVNAAKQGTLTMQKPGAAPTSSMAKPVTGAGSQVGAMAEDGEKWIQGAIKNPGAFTAKAKSHGMTPAQFRAKVLAHKEDYPAKTEKQAQLAKTLSKLHEVDAPQYFAQSSPMSTGGRNPNALESKKSTDKGNLNELSKSTLGSYTKKAAASATKNAYDYGTDSSKKATANSPETGKKFATANKRNQGIGKAVDRMTKKDVAEGLDQTVNLDNLDKLINRTDDNLARKGNPARYSDVQVDEKTKIIYWVTQGTTSTQSQEFAIRFAKILKNNGFNGWTVKVVRRDFYNGKRSPWKVASVEQGVAEGETTQTSTGRVHKGTYGTSYDDDYTAPPTQRGRGRPKKGADSTTGEVMKPDWSAFSKKVSPNTKLPTTRHKMVSEKDEQVNELSKDTLQKYADASKRDYNRTSAWANDESMGSYRERKASAKGDPSYDNSDHWSTKSQDKRVAGLKRAKARGVTPSKPGAGKYVSVGDQMRSDSRGTVGTWMEGSKPDFLDLDKDGNKKEPMKKAAKQKVKEGMEHKLQAARLEGKSHALRKMAYNCSHDDMEEARHYHDGFKEGLDECYGQMPSMGHDRTDTLSPEVGAMASYGAHDMDEGNAFTAGLASTPRGGSFSLGGNKFTDRSNYDSQIDEFAFESLDKQLNALLESEEKVSEGMTVSISKGQQGSPDSVSVSAQDGEADQLLSIIKSAGMGLFGGEDKGYGSTDGAAAAHGGISVVDDHDGMMSLMKKLSGGGDEMSTGDYEDEEGQESQEQDFGQEEHSHEGEEESCNECGMATEACACEGEEQVVDEVQTSDQMTDAAYESGAPDSGAAETEADDESEAGEDQALATADAGQDEEEGEEDSAEGEEEEKEEEVEESIYESYANSADDTFQADIDFMTKVISGGLNKQKSTGQTTIPVIPGQRSRMGSDGLGKPLKESTDLLRDYRKLSGL